MNKPRIAALGLAALLIFLLAGVAWAGRSTHYAINWQVMSGGGAPATTVGGVALNGSLGQTAIGPSSDSSYNLGAGYWYARVRLFRYWFPLIMKKAQP
jgi:hypothetical protein